MKSILDGREALAIFAKYPRAGCVKTRLIPHLGRANALNLHRAFLLDTLERTAGMPIPRWLFLADCSQQEMQRFGDELPQKLKRSLRIEAQHGRDLGERLHNADRSIRPSHPLVAFIGADSPTLPLEILSRAFERLQRSSVVFSPAQDGGYCLLGLSRPRPSLFQGIDWGSDRVLRQSLAKVPPGEAELLPSWYDVDRPQDLARLQADLEESDEGEPGRTLALLRSLDVPRP